MKYSELIGMDPSYGLTEEYLKTPANGPKVLGGSKGSPIVFGPYSQVLESHHGFLSNLSILMFFNLARKPLPIWKPKIALVASASLRWQ